MNIFVLNENPEIAATLVPIKVCNKMALEAAQMLAVACDKFSLPLPHKKDGSLYSPKSHVNHPCTKWVCESKENMMWLVLHGMALCHKHVEYHGKMPSQYKALLEVLQHLGDIDYTLHTPFVMAMPDEYKSDDVIFSYQRYIRTKPYYTEDNY